MEEPKQLNQRYVVWGPDGLPIWRPCSDVNDLLAQMVKFIGSYEQQGYYRDSSMRKLSLLDLAESLDVEIIDVHVEGLAAYRNYIEGNMGRIDQGGWVPVCFNEFLESEELESYLERGDA